MVLPKLKVKIEQHAQCIVFLTFELFLQLDLDILTLHAALSASTSE